MIIIAVVCAVLAMTLAATCAYADGAVLALEEDEPPSTPQVADLLARRERVHRALAFGRIVGQLVTGGAAAAALRAAEVPAAQLVPVVLLVGIIAVALTESIARTAGDAAGDAGASRMAGGIRLIEALCSPVVFFGSRLDAALLRLLPMRAPDAEEREENLEQFREVVAAEAEAAPDSPASVLLHGVFSLGDTVVREIMVPRVDIAGVERSTPWSEVVDAVRSHRHARLPVFDRTIDDVVGVLYAKDLLPSVVDGEEPAAGWLSLVRPAVFIPGTKSVDAQLRDFRFSHRHIAIVVDEYGGTSGLVTMEDALEVIVGEIRDEHDIEEPDIEPKGRNRWKVSAGLSLDEFSELVGEDFRREDIQTVGGLIYDLFNRIPKNGESMTVGDFRIVVERVDRRRVERVFFERIGHADASAEHA